MSEVTLEDGTCAYTGGTVYVKTHINIAGIKHNTPISVDRIFYHIEGTKNPCVWLKGSTGALSLVRVTDIFNAQ